MKDITQDRDGYGKRTHRIGEMVFELAFGAGGPADADALGWAVRHELLSPIEEVLEACDLDLSIQALEIDLGHHAVLDFGALRAVLCQHLQLALEAAADRSRGTSWASEAQAGRPGVAAGAAAATSSGESPVQVALRRPSVFPVLEARTLALALAKAVMTDAAGQAIHGHLQSLQRVQVEVPNPAPRAVPDAVDTRASDLGGGETMGAQRGNAAPRDRALGDPSSAEAPAEDNGWRAAPARDDPGRPGPTAGGRLEPLSGTGGRKSVDAATGMRDGARAGAHHAAGSAEPQADLAEAGAALLAIWRSDPLALSAAVSGADTAALRRLRAAVEAAGRSGTARPAPDRTAADLPSVARRPPVAKPETILLDICSMVLFGSVCDTQGLGKAGGEAGEGEDRVTSPGVSGRQDQDAPSAGQAIGPAGAYERQTARSIAGSDRLPGAHRSDGGAGQNAMGKANDAMSYAFSAAPTGSLAGPALLARWREDPAAALALFQQGDAAALALMLQQVLPLDDQGRPPPLRAALEDRFARHPFADQVLRAALRQMLRDAPIDFDVIEAEIAAAASRLEADSPNLRAELEGRWDGGEVGAGDPTGTVRPGLRRPPQDLAKAKGSSRDVPGAGMDRLSGKLTGSLAGPALLARWREDPAAALALFQQGDAAALALMLQQVLPLDDQGRPPPLRAALEDRFARHPFADQVLRAVLRQMLRDAPIDFDVIEAEIAAAASRLEADSPNLRAELESRLDGGEVGAGRGAAFATAKIDPAPDAAAAHPRPPQHDRDAGVRDAVVPPAFSDAHAALLALLAEAGQGKTDSGDDPRGEAVAALAWHHRGLLAAILGHPTQGLMRTVRLIALLPGATLEWLITGLHPGLDDRDREVIDLFWAAIPDDVMLAPLSEPTRWRFSLLAADGGIPRWGGAAGLVERALAWLAPQDPEAFAGRLAAVFDHAPPAGPAAARIGVRDALRAIGRVRATGPAAGQLIGSRAGGIEPGMTAPAAADTAVETGTELTEAAGLVLLAPWLPMLLERLGCSQGGVLAEPDRAMDALWNVLHGEVPVPQLVPPRPLERILCAIPEGVRLRPPERVEAETAELVESMLTAVLGQWRAVGQTSVEGLRETFLRREGLLRADRDQVVLSVAPKAYDMLVDRVPWGFRLVKYPWMDRPLHVNWRNNYG